MCTGFRDTLNQSLPLKFRQKGGQQSAPLRQAASAFPFHVDPVLCRHLKERLTSGWMMVLWWGGVRWGWGGEKVRVQKIKDLKWRRKKRCWRWPSWEEHLLHAVSVEGRKGEG